MQINERQKSWIKILISLGMIVAFGILVYVKQMGVYFETNDDRIIAEILSGAYSTAPDPHVIHENYLLTLPLSLLYRITVNIPWYGLCLLLFHVLAWFVIENSFLSRCEKWKEYCLVLAGLSGLFLGSLSLIGRIQFTSTAVMLAIAGYVALIMEKNTKKGFIMFFLLELFSFFVRYKAMLMIQPLGGITWLTLTLIQIADAGWKKEVLSEKGKEIGKIILIWGMIFALGGCGNIIGYHDISWRNYLRFSEARSQLFDYYGTPDYSEAKDILKEYNVSKNEYEAFCNYNILNWEVGTECVEKLVSFQKEKNQGQNNFMAAFRESFAEMGSESLQKINRTCVALWIMLIIGMILERHLERMIPLLGILLIRTALWTYLLYKGRTPARITYPLFTGEAILLFCVFAFFYLQENNKMKLRNTAMAIMICSVTLLVGYNAGQVQYRFLRTENEGQKIYMQGMQEMLDYCNNAPQKRFFWDGFSFNYYKGSALATNIYGPRNAMPFGNWFCNSPTEIERLKEYLSGDYQGIYFIAFDEGSMENYPAIKMLEEKLQSPAVLDDEITVSTGITYLVWRIGK